LRDHEYRASASHGVPVYITVFTIFIAPTHGVLTDKLTKVIYYILRRFAHMQTVTHPSTKQLGIDQLR